MIPVDLLGTLLKALDTNGVTRLIFVGDPNQLPPIGPGRPFVDIIDWFEKKHSDQVARLRTAMRADEDRISGGVPSVALQLASGFKTSEVTVDDDELLAAVARKENRGDLVVEFWENHLDLESKLTAVMETQLGIKPGLYLSLNDSFGFAKDKAHRDYTRSEAWQIISPTRTEAYGTEDINRQIQKRFKSALIKKCNEPGNPKPFGDYEIVWSDKVMQVLNRSIKAFPANGDALNYVANGEIGLVEGTQKGAPGKSDFLRIIFSTQPNHTYSYWRREAEDLLELAYALTVHKAQGSDFDTVIFIIPQSHAYVSRELIYTGLTRFRKKLVLLIEKDISTLIRMRNPESSATRLRNTQMFSVALRPGKGRPAFNEPLMHRTSRGVAVRSKSEVVVAEVFEKLGISYKYEERLPSKTDPKDFRLPDFTLGVEGDTYYWEHLGMLTVPAYREAWERKKKWYEANGYLAQLLTSEDGPNGEIDAQKIEQTARRQVLGQM